MHHQEKRELYRRHMYSGPRSSLNRVKAALRQYNKGETSRIAVWRKAELERKREQQKNIHLYDHAYINPNIPTIPKIRTYQPAKPRIVRPSPPSNHTQDVCSENMNPTAWSHHTGDCFNELERHTLLQPASVPTTISDMQQYETVVSTSVDMPPDSDQCEDIVIDFINMQECDNLDPITIDMPSNSGQCEDIVIDFMNMQECDNLDPITIDMPSNSGQCEDIVIDFMNMQECDNLDPITIEMPSNSVHEDSIPVDYMNRKENNSHEDNAGNIDTLIQDEPNDIHTDIMYEIPDVSKKSTDIVMPSDIIEDTLSHTSIERTEISLENTNIADIHDPLWVRPLEAEHVSEGPEIKNGTETSSNKDIRIIPIPPNNLPYPLLSIPIVYTTKINDMTISNKNINLVRGKGTIESIIEQSKPKLKLHHRVRVLTTHNNYKVLENIHKENNAGQMYKVRQNYNPLRTYSRKRKTESSSVNIVDQSLERTEIIRETIIDSGVAASTENNVEQVKDKIRCVNAIENSEVAASTKINIEQLKNNISCVNPTENIIAWFTTKLNQNSESSHTKLISKILNHQPKILEKINSNPKSELLQLKAEYDIIESDRELDQMISEILDDSLITGKPTDNKLINKLIYEEDTYYNDICCWYKRKKFAINSSNMNAQSNVVRSLHECPTSNCTCCCKPKVEKLVITPATLCSRHTSKFTANNINIKIELNDSKTENNIDENNIDVDSSESNMNTEIEDSNPRTEEDFTIVNSPVIQTLEALRDVRFTFNSEGKLVANLGTSINSHDATTLHLLDRIFSVVSDQITAHEFTPRDKISIELHNVLDKIKLDTNNETTTTRHLDQSMSLLPSINTGQLSINITNYKHTHETTDYDKAKSIFMDKNKANTIINIESSKQSNIATLKGKPYIDDSASLLFGRDENCYYNTQSMPIIKIEDTDEVRNDSTLNGINDTQVVKRKLEAIPVNK